MAKVARKAYLGVCMGLAAGCVAAAFVRMPVSLVMHEWLWVLPEPFWFFGASAVTVLLNAGIAWRVHRPPKAMVIIGLMHVFVVALSLAAVLLLMLRT